MTHIIDKLNAVANGEPVYIPTNLNPRNLVGILSQLGLTIPTTLSAAVAKNDLKDSGHRFTIKEVDAALSKADVTVTDRMRLKAAMGANNIIER